MRRASRRTISPAAGSLDPQALAGAQYARRLARQLVSVEQVAARLPRMATARAGWRTPAALGDQRVVERPQGLQLTHHAVASGLGAGPAGAAADLVAGDAEWELELQGFDRGVQRVAHGHVHRAGPRRVRAGALASGQRLVVHDLL